jgi:hypothetical protein
MWDNSDLAREKAAESLIFPMGGDTPVVGWIIILRGMGNRLSPMVHDMWEISGTDRGKETG